MGRVVRRYEIRARRKRRATIKKLKQRLAKAKAQSTIEMIMKRLKAVATAEHFREITQGGRSDHKRAA